MIFDSEITRVREVRINLRKIHEAENVQPIIYRDQDDVRARRQVRAVIERVAAAAVDKSSAGNEKHHWLIFFRAARPNVERQTIFTLLKHGSRLDGISVLHGRGSEFFCAESFIGRFQRLRSLPTKFSDGRLSIRNPQPSFYAVLVDETVKNSVTSFNFARLGGSCVTRKKFCRAQSKSGGRGSFYKVSARKSFIEHKASFLPKNFCHFITTRGENKI